MRKGARREPRRLLTSIDDFTGVLLLSQYVYGCRSCCLMVRMKCTHDESSAQRDVDARLRYTHEKEHLYRDIDVANVSRLRSFEFLPTYSYNHIIDITFE